MGENGCFGEGSTGWHHHFRSWTSGLLVIGGLGPFSYLFCYKEDPQDKTLFDEED